MPRIHFFFLAALSCLVLLGQTYTISTIAGGPLTAAVPGTSVALNNPRALVSDRSGHLFFLVAGGVMRWDAATGMVRQIAGDGTFGFSGDNGPAISAQFNSPQGLAIDSAGNLYVADTGNNRIRKIAGGVITTVAGNGLKFPHSVAVAADGSFYVLEEGNRIRRWAKGVISTVAGMGVAGASGDGGPAVDAELDRPSSLALDRLGSLYVADRGNHRIRKIAGGVITTVATGLHEPQGIAVGPDGSLCAGSQAGPYVYRISGGAVSVIAGKGYSAGDGIPALEARLVDPVCTVDAAGTVYIADLSGSPRIRKIVRGVIMTVAGGQAEGERDMPALHTAIEPHGVAVDAAGNVFIVDRLSSRALKIARGRITTVAGNGRSGLAKAGTFPATQAQLQYPHDLAVDGKGDVYIADHVWLWKISGGTLSTVAGGASGGIVGGMEVGPSYADNIPATGAAVSPLGIAVHANGDLYLGDRSDASSRVRKIAGGVITTLAGGGQSPLDDIPAISAQLAPPVALALDAAGNLYFADTFSHRIRKVSQGRLTTVAGNGNRGFNGDNGPATSAELNSPTGVAVDAAGALYIADSANRRVRKVVNGVITSIAGNGEPTFSGDDGPALSASLSPSELAVDAAGNVYLTDSVNGRVRMLQPRGQAPAGLAVAKPMPPAPPLAELEGRVVDPAGQPIRGASIFAKPVLAAQPELSEFLPSSAPRVLTNDRGEFHLRDLKPGSYRVRAAPPFDPNAKPATESALQWTYYPNASTWAEASTVTLAGGGGKGGEGKKIEIQMRQTRLSVVSGRVVYPAGWQPPQGTPEDPNPVVGSVMLMTAMGTGQVRRDGSFRIEGVPPGDHRLLAQVNGNRGTEYEQLTGTARIPGLVADASGIQMALELNARLHGTVTFAGSPPAEGFWIYLFRGEDGGGDPATYPRLWIDPKDPKFDFVRIQADDYRLLLGAGHARDRSLCLRVNGVELPFGGPFRVPGGTTQVTLQVTRHAGRVQGTVKEGKKDENGRPAVEAAVFLLPESATELLDAVRIGSTDEAGKYRILGVKPGRYRIGAAPGMSYDEAAKYATRLDFLRVLHSVATPMEVLKSGAINQAPPLRVASR